MKETRKQAYNRKRDKLNEQCIKCHKTSNPSWERCDYYCSIGRKIRALETEYSDVTGWSHKNWPET